MPTLAVRAPVLSTETVETPPPRGCRLSSASHQWEADRSWITPPWSFPPLGKTKTAPKLGTLNWFTATNYRDGKGRLGRQAHRARWLQSSDRQIAQRARFGMLGPPACIGV